MAIISYTIIRDDKRGFFVRGLQPFVAPTSANWPKTASAPSNTIFTILSVKHGRFGSDRTFYLCRALDGANISISKCTGEFEAIATATREPYISRLMEWWEAGDNSYEYALHCAQHLKPRITKLPPFKPEPQPEPGAAVLGGDRLPSAGAGVLGGIQGAASRLYCSASKAQIAAINETLKYGEPGIKLLMEAANDTSLLLTVRYAIKKALERNGIATNKNYF